MTLPIKIKLPDIYIEEMQEYQRISNKPTRTTSGQASFTNPRTLASHSTVGTIYDNQGEQGLGLLLYNISPKLKDYIFDDETYNLIRTSLNALDGKATLIDANSKGIATNSAVIDELVVNAGISTKIAPTSGKFYDFVGSSGILSQGSIDFAKTFAVTINTGTNTVEMTSLLSAKDGTTPTLLSDCFEVGEEITLADDSIREIFNVTNVDDGTATLTLSGNIAGTFANGANIYRSNVKTSAQAYKFGGFNAETIIDKSTPTQIVNSAFSTEGNGGRKIVRLDNGTLATVLYSPNDDGVNDALKFYKSVNNGDTWTLFATHILSSIGSHSIVLENNIIHVLLSDTAINRARFISYDIDGVLINNNISVEGTNQNSIGRCSLAIAPNGDLHATWASKNTTYPNSFNIRYSKSTNGGVTWDSPTQITTQNTSGSDFKNPTITTMLDDSPIIINDYNSGATINRIESRYFNGSSWTLSFVFINNGYTQSNPSVDVLSDGTIIVAWHGKDATDTSAHNIRFSQSTDNGVTWSTMEKLTSGNLYQQYFASITRNAQDEISILFGGITSSSNPYTTTRLIQGNSGSWSAVEDITTNTTANMEGQSACNNYRDFNKPLSIWSDGVDSDVKFYGEWTEGTETDVTTTDIRFNITPLEAVSDIGAYLNISNNINTVDAQVSIVDTLDSESYTDLVDTRYSIDANNDEVASLLNASLTANEKVTLKYTLNRNLTTDDIDINSILGGVA